MPSTYFSIWNWRNPKQTGFKVSIPPIQWIWREGGLNMANNEGWGNSQLYQKSTKLVVFCWMLWFVWDASCQEVIIQEGDVIWGRAMNNYFNLFLSKYHDIIMKVGRWEAISFVNCKILKHAFVLFSNNNIE